MAEADHDSVTTEPQAAASLTASVAARVRAPPRPSSSGGASPRMTGGEMAHLQGQRILLGYDGPLGLDRRPPAVALVAAINPGAARSRSPWCRRPGSRTRRCAGSALSSPEVSSQLQGAAAESEMASVPSAPLAKRSRIAAVSSTGKPRAAEEVAAWTSRRSRRRDCADRRRRGRD